MFVSDVEAMRHNVHPNNYKNHNFDIVTDVDGVELTEFSDLEISFPFCFVDGFIPINSVHY